MTFFSFFVLPFVLQPCRDQELTFIDKEEAECLNSAHCAQPYTLPPYPLTFPAACATLSPTHKAAACAL